MKKTTHATPATRADRSDTVTLGTTDSLDTTSAGPLAHLGELDDCKIADGEPDIRGWDVKGADGRKLGEVADLLVDTGAMKVRYVEVKLEKEVAEEAARAGGTADARTDPTRYVLVPVGAARLDDEHDDVCLDARASRLAGVPAYRRDEGLTREYETGLLNGYGATPDAGVTPRARAGAERAGPATDDFYAGRDFDDRTFFGDRRRGRDDRAYVIRAEERVIVGVRHPEGEARS